MKSKFYILTEPTIRDSFLEKLSTYKGIEDVRCSALFPAVLLTCLSFQILISKCLQNQENPNQEHDHNDESLCPGDLLPSYIAEAGAEVSMSTAIALVNR
jgi:hypothetical protein